jgi:tetratricopeptide (TPR) repeat protein
LLEDPLLNMPLRTARRTRFFPFSRVTLPPPVGLRIQLRGIKNMLDQGGLDSATRAASSMMKQAPYDIRVLALNAQCMAASHDHIAAIQIYDRLLTQQDSDVIWAAKARSLMALGRYRRASSAFARATALARTTRFIAEQAACSLAAGKLNDAFEVLESVDAPSKADTSYQLIRAKVLTEMGELQSAFGFAIRAAENDQTGQAIALARQNMPEMAPFSALCYRTALRTTSPQVLAEISWDQPDCITQSNVDQLVQTIDDPSRDNADKAHAHLALFRKFDQMGDRFQALGHLRKYHALSAKQTKLHRSQDSAMFAMLTQLKAPRLQPSKSRVLPIFVTGLPGSGRQHATAVLVQAARCDAARPLSLVPAVMARFSSQLSENGRTKITRTDLLYLQAELREGLEQAANGCDVIVDSTALNFRWSGLIAAALPEARIVHLKRAQMATGWALHKGGISGQEFGCHHDLSHIQAFQHRCAALMAHWEENFAPNVMGISGDALARSSGVTVQAMIEACQLKWSDRCRSVPYCPDRSWHGYAAYLNPLRQPIKTSKNMTCDHSPM